MSRKSGENLGMTYCHNLGGNQVFAYTKRKQIMSDDNCLDASSKHGPVKLVRCHGMGGNQAWVYDEVVSEGILESAFIYLFVYRIGQLDMRIQVIACNVPINLIQICRC